MLPAKCKFPLRLIVFHIVRSFRGLKLKRVGTKFKHSVTSTVIDGWLCVSLGVYYSCGFIVNWVVSQFRDLIAFTLGKADLDSRWTGYWMGYVAAVIKLHTSRPRKDLNPLSARL